MRAAQDASDWDDALCAALSAGIVVTDRRLRPIGKNSVAHRLTDADGDAEFAGRWESLREQLVPMLDDVGDGIERATVVNVMLDVPGRDDFREMRVDVHGLGEVGVEGFLFLIRDRDVLATLARDLHQAGRSRALTELRRSQIHDLRAPLNAVSLNLDLAAEQLQDPAGADRDRDIQEKLVVIGREINRLSRLVSSLLTPTDPHGGARRRFDLRRLVREIAELLEPAANARGLEIAVETDEPPVVVSGHRDQLKQATLNLAVNGLQSMTESGAKLGLNCGVDGNQATVELIDQGCGIPAERMDRLFELHFTTKKQGSGIGLFVARSTFVAHGGSLDVESTPGEGTRVLATLPLATDVPGEDDD